MFIMAFIGFLGQCFISKGLALVEPAKGSMMNYLQIVYSNIFGIFILNE